MAAQLTKSKCTSLFLSRKSFLFFITFYTKCSMLYTVLKIIDLWIIPQVTNTHTPAERNLGCITKVVLSRGRPGQGLLGWVPLGTVSLGELQAVKSAAAVCARRQSCGHISSQAACRPYGCFTLGKACKRQGLDLSPRRCHEPERPWGTHPGQHVAVSLCCCHHSRPGEAGGLQAPG